MFCVCIVLQVFLLLEVCGLVAYALLIIWFASCAFAECNGCWSRVAPGCMQQLEATITSMREKGKRGKSRLQVTEQVSTYFASTEQNVVHAEAILLLQLQDPVPKSVNYFSGNGRNKRGHKSRGESASNTRIVQHSCTCSSQPQLWNFYSGIIQYNDQAQKNNCMQKTASWHMNKSEHSHTRMSQSVGPQGTMNAACMQHQHLFIPGGVFLL
jgi:hypothetical protein